MPVATLRNKKFIGKPKSKKATPSKMNSVSANSVIKNGGKGVSRNLPRKRSTMAGPMHQNATGSYCTGGITRIK